MPDRQPSERELIELGRAVHALLAADKPEIGPWATRTKPPLPTPARPTVSKSDARNFASSYGLSRQFVAAVDAGEIVFVITKQHGQTHRHCDTRHLVTWCQRTKAILLTALQIRFDQANADAQRRREQAQAST
jgi:hypothetical protein